MQHRCRLCRGTKSVDWRAAWAGRCFVQVSGRAAYPFMFGLTVETKGRCRTLFVAKAWPRREQPGGSHTRGRNHTAEWPSRTGSCNSGIVIGNGWASCHLVFFCWLGGGNSQPSTGSSSIPDTFFRKSAGFVFHLHRWLGYFKQPGSLSRNFVDVAPLS